ncbi:ribosome maturation protein SBDS, putative [Cryptosporidium muris RN66]|uniref:Ribosome maturation protein SBDS, putative n=1 Tax=Cryptosporidium muris (strain RN66) TaxID=441375 RepID=B6AC29_CRYMR|nr:ribosome maturation protein SBDS, putative [Cryptosporidium muris RN66]EEA05382.1 ribosome maturation protein SBDS, putative [Cryptosporidium muris RN66]|eukprot:XP_002139731.1 ribosome maturation protein SBDS [Cryptosporidium muris RN66]
MSLFQPSSQIRLTNVAIVRYKTHGKRFEVACYKNKILNWRSGVEWDLDEVLQIHSIFTNVSKGHLASTDDLIKVFGTVNIESICRVILRKGEVQVSEAERSYMMEKQYLDICNLLSEMTVNPSNNLPLTVKMLETELREAGFSVSLNKSTKEQALKAFDILKKRIPNQISRAKMLLRFISDFSDKNFIFEKLEEFNATDINIDESNDKLSVTFLCDPYHYRSIDKLPGKLLVLNNNVKKITKDKSQCKVETSKIDNIDGNSGLCNEIEVNGEINNSSDLLNVDMGTMTTCDNHPNQKFIKKILKIDKSKDIVNNVACTKCGIELDSLSSFRTHCRSEWHIFNAKRLARNLSPISEDEFLELQQDIKMGFLAVE